MADLKALSGEMAKLKRQLETVLYISGYPDMGLSSLKVRVRGVNGRGSNTKLLFPLFRII